MAKNCVFSKLSEKSPAKVWSCEIIIVPLHPQMRKAPSATTHGVLVQLVRMPACHAGGHEFESRTHRFHIATNGALVQLVRMPACHAGGHEFESRTHRKKHPQKGCFFVYILFTSLVNNWIGSDQLQKVELPEVAKGRLPMEPPFATIGFDLLIMIDSYYFSIATTPGSTLPSMASNMAPPPVET